jgi:small ligand-binding sensory domain FIST
VVARDGASSPPCRTHRSAADLLGGIPLAGFFADGEIGPIAGRNALHTFTASMALFIE